MRCILLINVSITLQDKRKRHFYPEVAVFLCLKQGDYWVKMYICKGNYGAFIRVKNWLLYLAFAAFATIAFDSSAEKTDFPTAESQQPTTTPEVDVHYLSIASAHADLCLPQQTSGSSLLRLQNTQKRNYHTLRYSYSSGWSNKGFMHSHFVSNSNNSLNFPSLVTKSAHYLISLGKLVI